MNNMRRIVIPEFMIGEGARTTVGSYAVNLGAKNVLLVTDENVRKAGHASLVQNILKEHGINYVVYDNVTPNPKDHEVAVGAELFRKSKCDCIVAVGGGSPIDCAKGIAILSTNGGDIADYEGVDMIPEPIPPMICIPTTAGTSADVSQFAIITNTDENYKMAIISKIIVPDVSLIDPVTLLTMDADLTATTGMDALTHAIEALVSTAGCPFTDVQALDAAKVIYENLGRTLDNPKNMKYRLRMMRASLEAGIAFSNASLGAVHAMAHSLGGFLDLPHGECNAVLLPHVIRHNFANSSFKYTKLAKVFGFEGGDSNEAADFLIESINALNKSVGIKNTIKGMGVKSADINTLASKALNDPCMITNPKEMDLYEISSIFKEA